MGPAIGAGHSVAGRARKVNEDAILVDHELRTYAVCDGAGGHVAGAEAASTCVEVVQRGLAERRELLDAVARGEKRVTTALSAVDEVVQSATAEVFARSQRRGDGECMATTLTLLHFAGASAIFAHVGDTRLYRRRDAVVEQITRDHTLLARYRELGIAPPGLSEEQMAHGLTRAVGVEPTVQVDKLAIQVRPGDRYVICSDGLSRYLDRGADLAELFSGAALELPRSLTRYALDSGGVDDVSAIVVDVNGTA